MTDKKAQSDPDVSCSYKDITVRARSLLDELDVLNRRRHLKITARTSGQGVLRDGRSMVSFSDNDYLGLSMDERVIAAASEAASLYGAGAGASRLVTGDHPLYAAFEKRLAAFKGEEAALVFGSGYMANIGTIPVFAGKDDLILIDRLAHACLYAGAQLSGARLLRFRHNDRHDLARLLARHRSSYRHALVVTDGVFSMDGDQACLHPLLMQARHYDAWLLVDDAHGLGVLGEGRGTAYAQKVKPDLSVGTLSKALGSYGGYVAGDRAVIDLLANRARSLIYTTALPPMVIGAALKALEIMESDPDLCARPLKMAAEFCARLDLPAPTSAIVPLMMGTEKAALDAQAGLEQAGFLVVAIRPPTVPRGTARLRLSFSAAHRDEDVAGLADAVRQLGLV